MIIKEFKEAPDCEGTPPALIVGTERCGAPACCFVQLGPAEEPHDGAPSWLPLCFVCLKHLLTFNSSLEKDVHYLKAGLSSENTLDITDSQHDELYDYLTKLPRVVILRVMSAAMVHQATSVGLTMHHSIVEVLDGVIDDEDGKLDLPTVSDIKIKFGGD